MIGSARLSAFLAESQAFVAATPQPNSINCPGVIGQAARPSESAGDKVILRSDPNAISYLEMRQSVRPHQKHESHRMKRSATSGVAFAEATGLVEVGATALSELQGEDSQEDENRNVPALLWINSSLTAR